MNNRIPKAKRNKRVIIILYLLISSTILSACEGTVGRREIEDLGIVTAIGVDYVNDEVIVTLEVVNPLASSISAQASSTKTEGQKYVYPQGRGKTIKDAISNINLYFDKKIFLSHSNILVLGEEFAKRGTIDLMDFFIRDSQPREDMYIVVAKGARASDIIGVKAGLGRPTGTYLYDTLNNFSSNGKSINISIAEKYRYYYDVSNEPVIGLVQLKEVLRSDDELKKEEQTAKVLDVAGGAVLSRDRLVGYFDGDEMMGFNFIVGDFKRGAIVFRTPVEDKDKKGTIIGADGVFTSLDIVSAKTKREITVNDGKIHLTIDVKLKAGLNEINQALDVIDEEVMTRIEKACSDKVKELISTTLEKGQKEFKQDSFSIGVTVHQQHPKLWKEIATDWNNIFPEITYDVKVETTIVKIGLMNLPANLRRK